MKVRLIGKTEVDLLSFQGDGRPWHMPGKAARSKFEERVQGDAEGDPFNLGVGTGQELIEFAGRLCYESFDLPNIETATNSGYIYNIIRQGHESVLEHVSVTFYIEGVSRNLSHELIRHRHLSFSELSQRFVNMEEAKFVNPPLWRDLEPEFYDHTSPMPSDSVAAYRANVRAAEESGASRKEARQSARYALPQGTETKLVVTGNLRAWRDVLKKRWSKHADAEIQELAACIHHALVEHYPDVFADIEYQD